MTSTVSWQCKSLTGGQPFRHGAGNLSTMTRLLDLTGRAFGRWTVLERAANRSGRTFWVCECECGTRREVQAGNLLDGKTISCGCLRAEQLSARRRIHGKSRTSASYQTWAGMIARCTKPESTAFSYYGGRGIAVCERWRSFEAFLADMGERPDGLSLDRIDSDGHYEPGNCRWATPTQQARNTRRTVIVEWQGERVCLADLAERYGLNYSTVRGRLSSLKWSLDKALGTPPRHKNSTSNRSENRG